MKRIFLTIALLVTSLFGSMHTASAEEDAPCLLDVGYPEVCRMFVAAEQEGVYGISVTVADIGSPGMSRAVVAALTDGATEDDMTPTTLESLPTDVDHTLVVDDSDPDQLVSLFAVAHEGYVIVIIGVSDVAVEEAPLVELYEQTAEKLDDTDTLNWDVLPTEDELPFEDMRVATEGSLLIDGSATPEAATPAAGTPEATGTPE